MKIVLSTSSLAYSHGAELKRAFSPYDPEVHRPTSIWIRVV